MTRTSCLFNSLVLIRPIVCACFFLICYRLFDNSFTACSISRIVFIALSLVSVMCPFERRWVHGHHRRWFFALGGAGTLLSVPDLSGSSLSELLSSKNAGAMVLKIFCSLWRYILYIRLYRILVHFFDERHLVPIFFSAGGVNVFAGILFHLKSSVILHILGGLPSKNDE